MVNSPESPPYADPPHDLEFRARWQDESNARTIVGVRAIAALAIGGNFVFLFADRLLVADLTSVLVPRAAMILGMLVCAGLSFVRGMKPHAIALAVAAILVLGLCITALTLITGGVNSSYHQGLLLVMMGSALFVSWGMLAATIMNLSLVAIYVAAVLTSGAPIHNGVLGANIAVLATAAIVSALGAELSARLRWRELTGRSQLETASRVIESSLEEQRNNNQRLEEAQRRIGELMATSSEALLNLPAWIRRTSNELIRNLEATDIGVWTMTNGTLAPLIESSLEPPELAVTGEFGQASSSRERDGTDLVIPVQGMTGERIGFVVATRPLPWSETERRILGSFAHQLGGTFELQKAQASLAKLHAARIETREQMAARGSEPVRICLRCSSCYGNQAEVCTTDGERLDDSVLVPYRLLGRYRLVRRLGEGGMGTVYAAVDETLAREVAIKLVRLDAAYDADARARLVQEGRVLARIRHPNVISVFDSGMLEDGTGYIITNLLNGADLQRVLDLAGPGTPEQVASLLVQGAAALAATHNVGLIHRDIKPANIFLCPEPDGSFVFQLLDFGIAKTLRADERFTRSGLLVGTPRYMSPEQIVGKELDARSDVYSFALVVLEALIGTTLVKGEDLVEILMSVATVDVPPVSGFIPGTPESVDRAFRRALEKRREERPSDVVEWAQSLAQELASLDASRDGWPNPLPAARHASSVTTGSVTVDDLLRARNSGRRSWPPAR